MHRSLILVACAVVSVYGCNENHEEAPPISREGAQPESVVPLPSTGVDALPGKSETSVEESTITRLIPSDIRGIPQPVVRELLDRQCTIPQAWSGWASTPNNFASGDFAQDGSIDWAVLCSDSHSSRIVVVWEGPAPCQTEFGESPDDSFVTRMDGETVFARTISAPDPKGGGIADVYQGKGGVTYFCRGGDWVESVTSD